MEAGRLIRTRLATVMTFGARQGQHELWSQRPQGSQPADTYGYGPAGNSLATLVTQFPHTPGKIT